MSSLTECNLMSKLPYLQPRLILHPWVKRSIVRCLSEKAGDPDFPVKYIPKKLRDVNQKQCYSPGGDAPHSTSSWSSCMLERKALDRIQRPQGDGTDHEKSNVAHDNVHGVCKEIDKHHTRSEKSKCSKELQKTVQHVIVPDEVVQELQIYEKDSQGQQQITLNQTNSDHNVIVKREYMKIVASYIKEMQLYNGNGEVKQKNSGTCSAEQDAKNLAIQILAKRALTRTELWKKLNAKKFPVIVVEEVVRDFQDRGLINDRLYAEMFASSRWKSSSWGPRRIKQELLKKGIKDGEVERAVKLVFEDKNCDERSNIILSGSSFQQLYLKASKQWQQCKNVAHKTRKARVIRWLQYRGFDWGVVRNILKKLEAECP